MTASGNTAVGDSALFNNTTGDGNVANGRRALYNNTTGIRNIAIGDGAGIFQSTGSDNIYIGPGMGGVPGENNSCYIQSIWGQTSGAGAAVYINGSHKLGTATSSKRFKQDIKPMDKASEAILALKPVTFHYKKEIDPAGISQFGLVAEDVEKVNRDLVVRDKEGKPYSVRYDQVNAMLLNEFLKAHSKMEQQEAIIAELKSTVAQEQKSFQSKLAKQQKQVEALASGLQKVTAQVEMGKPVQKVAVNQP